MSLEGLQGFILDLAIPLVNMLESARSGSLNTRDTAESAQQALKLLGNASTHVSVERRCKASACLTPHSHYSLSRVQSGTVRNRLQCKLIELR